MKRIVLGVGYPWFERSVWKGVITHRINLIDDDGMTIKFNEDWDEDDLCDGKKYKLVLEAV